MTGHRLYSWGVIRVYRARLNLAGSAADSVTVTDSGTHSDSGAPRQVPRRMR